MKTFENSGFEKDFLIYGFKQRGKGIVLVVWDGYRWIDADALFADHSTIPKLYFEEHHGKRAVRLFQRSIQARVEHHEGMLHDSLKVMETYRFELLWRAMDLI